MTIITCKDNMMAADTAVHFNNGYFGDTIKIVKINDMLIGSAGEYHECLRFRQYVSSGYDLEDWIAETEEFESIILNEDGIRTISKRYDKNLKIKRDFYAIGAGRDIALGAMMAGASASDAVNYVIDYHSLCKGNTIIMTL